MTGQLRYIAVRIHRLVKVLKCEEGSAESAMVLIPLLITFLVGAQIVVATHSRNLLRVSIQDQATSRSISGDFDWRDQFLHIESSGDGQELDLLVAHGDQEIPLLLQGEVVWSGLNGAAIVENRR